MFIQYWLILLQRVDLFLYANMSACIMCLFILHRGCPVLCYVLLFACEWDGARSVHTLFINDNQWWRLCVSFLTAINAHNHSLVYILPLCLSSVLHLFEFPCIHPLRAPVLQDCGRLTAQFASPPLFIRLSWSKAKLCETSPAPGLPAVLMALGRRHEQEDLRDLLSAAVTGCLQPASYQAQQPHKPLVLGCTPLRSRRRILKPATSNNSRTNLGIGELE